MSSSKAPRRRSPAVVALLAVLALAGCGAGTDDDPDTGANPKPSGSDTAESSAESEPSEEPEPSAADGTDYAKCDSQCEVEVTEGIVFEFEMFTLTITDITADGIEIATDDGAGSTGGASISDYCAAYLSAGSLSLTCYGVAENVPAALEPAADEVAIGLLHLAEDTAIIRMTVG
jgi:hypothetical protein